MTARECNRESEIMDAVSAGLWLDSRHEELRSHAAACRMCADLVEVFQALQTDLAETVRQVQVPSAGLVWWRAELRARREALRTAERPLTLIPALAGACGVGVLAALLAWLSPWLRASAAELTGISVTDLVMVAFQQHLPLTLMLGGLIILAPVAIYFVFSDK